MKSEQLLAAFTDSSGEAVAETEEVLPDTEDIDEVSDADAASDVEQNDIAEEEITAENELEELQPKISGESTDPENSEAEENTVSEFSDGENAEKDYKEKIIKISIGNGVTSIGDRAFKKCVSLSKITFSQSLEGIYKNAQSVKRQEMRRYFAALAKRFLVRRKKFLQRITALQNGLRKHRQR
ncbi:leucine-rich repeat protein [Blautia luti]|jgi:hypothetical protein|uniref:leucine-rich repeat protein n=1 Tax=Blautia TaxID=572511 RepID=UPI0015712302|nr:MULTISPECIES: leucine-rich repeat protein [Blautia]NSK41725.1 leucine-rich repeat protein [Blautia luti]NSY29967.1 leucine-rich repeat protein [Blautia sp. MSK.21.1]